MGLTTDRCFPFWMLSVYSLLILQNSGSSQAWGSSFQPPAITSPWMQMTSQVEARSFICWNHGLRAIPIKVDVQVRPLDPKNQDFVFPGTASAHRDTNVASPYGGILYRYNSTSVLLYAPNNHYGNGSGYSIFTGDTVWKGPTKNQVADVQIRVRVWNENALPEPDFKEGWLPIEKGFKEIPHNISGHPAMVVVQFSLSPTLYIADGIGYIMRLETSTSWGGLLFAYNNQTIRIWKHDTQGVYYITDGWGMANQAEHFDSGLYRIIAWKSLSSQTNFKTYSLPNPNHSAIQLSTPIDQDCDIVQVMVKEESTGHNKNAGYHFPATGAVQNIMLTSLFAGVVYSYSNSSLRLWYPPVSHNTDPTDLHYFILIDRSFGGPSSNATRAIVEISTYSSCIQPNSKALTSIAQATRTTTVVKTTLSLAQSLSTTTGANTVLATTIITPSSRTTLIPSSIIPSTIRSTKPTTIKTTIMKSSSKTAFVLNTAILSTTRPNISTTTKPTLKTPPNGATTLVQSTTIPSNTNRSTIISSTSKSISMTPEKRTTTLVPSTTIRSTTTTTSTIPTTSQIKVTALRGQSTLVPSTTTQSSTTTKSATTRPTIKTLLTNTTTKITKLATTETTIMASHTNKIQTALLTTKIFTTKKQTITNSSKVLPKTGSTTTERLTAVYSLTTGSSKAPNLTFRTKTTKRPTKRATTVLMPLTSKSTTIKRSNLSTSNSPHPRSTKIDPKSKLKDLLKWILIGYCSCLASVFLLWLWYKWYCGKSTPLKKSNKIQEVKDLPKRKESAWGLETL